MGKKSNKTSSKKVQMISARSELFIGLVGATGVNLDSVFKNIKIILKNFNYDVHSIKISDFFYDPYFQDKYGINIGEKNKNNRDIFQKIYSKTEDKNPTKSMPECNEFQNIYLKMEAGNTIREKSPSLSILAKHCIQAIQKIREEKTEDTNKEKGMAYIFQSLKNPEESKLLSEIYSSGYYQIGVYATEKERFKQLVEKGINKDDIQILIKKDMNEENKPHGQKTRDTFQVSDFFIKQGSQKEQEKSLGRIFDLIFGHPYRTPKKDEHAMYMAYAYSTRSADLSRQVGAVICNEMGDIIGLGSNDVPCFGGGPYWPDHEEKDEGKDWRDYRYIQEEWQNNKEKNKDEDKKGQDANQINRDQIIEKIIKICDHSDLKKIENLKEKLLKDTGINDIKEFGRPTHAEMSAILNCTRNGISPKGGTIYCTTFPCHNCTRHIIDAGIKRVVFVEPYPSSKAKLLHSDSISVEPMNGQKNGDKVRFEHFIGVAARRYLDLFSLKLGMGLPIKRKDKEGKTIDWNPNTEKVRVPLVTLTYLEKEKNELLKLNL